MARVGLNCAALRASEARFRAVVEHSHDEVSAEISGLEAKVRSILDQGSSPLPRSADLARISAWAVDAQRRHWQWT